MAIASTEKAVSTAQLQWPLIIAGSCAAESEGQTRRSATEALYVGVEAIRVSVRKPRTKPGYDGPGIEGLPWLTETVQRGIIPATEVLTTAEAEAFATQVADQTKHPVIMWLGSRSQNHDFQKTIASIAASRPNILLLIKNQPWQNEEHWLGIVDHVREGGMPDDRIILAHRGFSPEQNRKVRRLNQSGEEEERDLANPEGWRNLPDLRMAMRVKAATGLPMLIDPSHIVGQRDGVLPFAEEVMAWEDENGNGFDGAIIEVHENPAAALTDAKQQVIWGTFAESLPYLMREVSPRIHPIEALDKLRLAIDALDMRILQAMRDNRENDMSWAERERWELVEQVGVVKRSHGRRSLDTLRWTEVLSDRIATGVALGLSEEKVRAKFETIHAIALDIEGVINR